MEPKSCRVRQYQIKPLSLHQRAHSFDKTWFVVCVCVGEEEGERSKRRGGGGRKRREREGGREERRKRRERGGGGGN